MSNGNHIRAVGPGEPEPSDSGAERQSDEPFAHDELMLTEDDFETFEEAPEDETRAFGWLVPAIAIAAILVWTVFFGWSLGRELPALASVPPSRWTGWIAEWSVPVLLVCVLWLLALRDSRAEARRFGRTAHLLSRESRELENRLSVVNRELSLAREFLATQSRELESLGRIAAERIGAHAGELQSLIARNGEQVDRIGSASETALANMNRLRDDLPVVATSTRDMSNQIGNLGRTAQDQLDGLTAGFERLEEFGSESETRAAAVDRQIGETLSRFEETLGRIEHSVAARYDMLQEKVSTYRSEVDEAERIATDALSGRVEILQSETKAIGAALRDAEAEAMAQLEASRDRFHEEVARTVASLDNLDREAIAASQRRIKELHEEAGRFDDKLAERDRRFLEEIARRQDAFDAREAEASETLAQRLAHLDTALAERREAQLADTERLVAQSTTLREELDKLRSLIAEIAQQGDATRETLTGGLNALGEDLSQRRAALDGAKAQFAELTESGIRLLEIIQSGARYSSEDLGAAIGRASDDLESVEQRAEKVAGVMFRTREGAEGLGDYLIETNRQVEAIDESIQGLKIRLAEQSEDALAKLNGLRGGFARLAEESDVVAASTQERMLEALTALEQAIDAAFVALDKGAKERIGDLASSLSKNAVEDIERTLRDESGASIAQLEDAAKRASGAGREATVLLRDQLGRVNELIVNLEQRVAQAREKAQEQTGNDFARRMALITDSLNSNSIDIASAFSADVTDTAWDAYLKGDRGIFTRRAARLLEKGEARAIADLYQREDAFKNAVNRYIHDFEAMLRSMLSTRDGNALAVTMLGSDSGKLYVALAQALERIRA